MGGALFTEVRIKSSEDIQLSTIDNRLSTLSDENEKNGDKRICLKFWSYSNNITATPVKYTCKREHFTAIRNV